MTETLQNCIVRNAAGRIFLVERDPGWPTPAQLRRLDRQPREQARITRPSAEVRAMEVMVARSQVNQEMHDLKAACRDLLQAWGAWPKPTQGAEYLIPGWDPHLNHLADLVGD